MNKPVCGITLIELLVAISLIGLLFVGISTLDTFARFYLLSSDHRIQIQNEVSYVLEHMAKKIGQGIGSPSFTGARILADGIKVRLDSNANFMPDDDDNWIGYRYIPAQKEIQYHAICDGSLDSWPAGGGKVISGRVIVFNPDYNPDNNYIFTEVLVCWNPNMTTAVCGDIENPQIKMITQIKMSAVSVN